ncbi:hypothetical protein [Caudoviricetes sp.]|nr:hypothetical protein [Caudoviricetes sp.]
MTFGERVKAQTRQFLLPKVVYNVFGSNILANRLISNGKRGKGYAVEKAIKYQNSNQAAAFSGLDTFQAQQLETKIRLSVEMKAARQPIGLGGLELLANSDSEVRVTDMIAEALEETQDELMEKVGDYGYGDGTAESSKAPIGLGGIVDDGTSVTTFEGQSRSTYSVLNATRTSLTGVLGELSLPRLATLYTNISSGTGLTTPTLLISSETEWDLYEQLLTPTVRETYSSMGYYTVTRNSQGAVRQGSQNGLVGQQGFVALSYKGIPWVRDEKATSQNVFMLNENFLDWWGWRGNVLGYEAVDFNHVQTESTYNEAPMSQFSGFLWSSYKTAQNQFAGIADVIIVGNFGSWQPRRQGRLTEVTTV